MAEYPAPKKGRGAALLELVRKHKESQAVGVEQQEEKAPPKCRGRAAMLQRLQELKETKAGGDPYTKEIPPLKTLEPERTRVETLTKATQELQIAEPSGPCHYRGESGKPLKASANYIRINVEQDRGVFEYEVRFVPDVDARSNRIKLVNSHLGEMRTTKVYDGSFCLYLPSQLYTGRKEFESVIPNTDEAVTTIFTYKRKSRLSECLHLYNVLFKRIMHVLLYTQMGRNYFSPDHRHIIPQHRLEVFPGYAVAVDEVEDGLMVCLDTQHRVIRSQTAYELLQELKCANPKNFKPFALSNIVGSCVLTQYNNKTYIIDDISWTMKPTDTFPMSRGGVTSFVEYYKTQYNITIKDIGQPMLISKKSVNQQGNKVEHLICLIPELCYLTGLTDAMRSDFKIMKDVAAYTRITPNQRIMALRTYLDKVSKSEKAQEVLGGWGLKLATINVDVPARVLPSEKIFFGAATDGGSLPSVIGGTDWNRAVGDNRMTGPINLMNWQLFYTPRDAKFAKNFAEMMVRLAKGMGCIIKDPRQIQLPDDRTETYMTACQSNIVPGVQVVVFICPTMRTDRYSVIKKICCTQIPIASQVILSKTLANPNKVRTIIQKIAMQITCKLGGTLWHVQIPIRGLLVCGIDVYHGKGQSSVCAFVASIDESCTRWFSEALFQEREIGDFFKISFKKSLLEQKKSQGAFPCKIVIFRDGVGDGQLNHVKLYEMTQFQDALRELEIEASITFVVVQKRINTRIFAMTFDGGSADNPPAGTVVDSIVTRRNLYDFYLIPQSVRQGTVNPSHYIVLHDDAKMKPDHLQRLAYKMCHLYYNWCGTIRVPAPCQYAHKLASLVGQHIKKIPSAELNTRLYYL